MISAHAIIVQLEWVLVSVESVAVALVDDARGHKLLLAVWALLELWVLQGGLVVLLVEIV